MKRFVAVIASSLILMSLVAGCRSGAFPNHYSTSDEIKIGQDEAQQIETSEKMDIDAKDNQRVQNVAQAIFEQARKLRPDVPYQIHIIDSREVNAFSLPGGFVFVYTGLLDKIGSDDDALACIIGHESSHVVFRHAVKQMSDQDIKGNLVDIVGLLSNNYEMYNTAGALYELDQLHYSRQDEYQADKYGLMFAYNAGYDPYGMPRFFTKLEKLEKESDSLPAYEEDHPITRNRILRSEELIRELRQNNGVYPSDVANSQAGRITGAVAMPDINAPAPPVPPDPAAPPHTGSDEPAATTVSEKS